MTDLCVYESDERRDDDDLDRANDEIISEGEAAIDRIARGQHFYDWVSIAKAVDIGRNGALRKSGANHPRGSTYNKAFGKWLDEHPKFKAINSATMSHLSEILKNLEEIEKWRATLAANERMKLNHPEVVLRKWKARTQPPRIKRTNTMREAVQRLEEENLKLRKENASLWRRVHDAEDAAAAAAEEEEREFAEGKAQTPERTLERVNKLFRQLSNDNRHVRSTATDKLYEEIKRGAVDLRDLHILRLNDNEYSNMAKAMSTQRRLSEAPEAIARDIDHLWPVDTIGQARQIAECWFALVKVRERELS